MRGIGGSSAAQELAAIRKDLSHVKPITESEREQRRQRPVV